MTEGYIELHAASAFSFLEGASLPEDLIQRAAELNMPAMALLDRNGVYGSARFHTLAKKHGIRAHVGAEIAVANLGNRLMPPDWLPSRHTPEAARLPLLCASRTGYQNLCQLITRFKMRETTKCEGAATFDDLAQYASGLVCLTGGDEGPMAAALMHGGESAAVTVTEKLVRLFGPENVFVELQRHENREEEWRNQAAIRVAHRLALASCWQPMAYAMPHPTTAKYWMCLPPPGTIQTWNMPGACSRSMDCATCARQRR